jgi:hypothetical protein
MILMQGLGGLNGEEDRARAISYCGAKFGFQSTDYAPCVNFYVAGMAGEYKAQATGGSSSGGSSLLTSLLTNITAGVVKGFTDDTPAGGPPPGYIPPPPAPAWYMTPTGMIGLGAGALVLFLMLRK